MFSLGSAPSSNSGHSPRPGRWAAAGPVVLAVLFLVALVLAANNSTVLGWFIAIIALGWLILATAVYIGVAKAARFGAEQMRKAQAALLKQQSGQSGADGRAGTRLLDEAAPVDGARDLKLEHSFKIVQVQARLIAEELARGEQGSPENIGRALETIEVTTQNGRDMLGGAGERQSRRTADRQSASGRAPEGGGEPLSGVVIQD